ncbi:MAG: UDP-N-acetylmuramate--L-alanine ligase [Flavobacteriales bacterium]|nr:UDP-N-acetylmuramate--L-alanine ligase [Flavobacteriales bacterium]
MKINDVNNVYFLGVGGIGMSALARYFLAQGCKVSGYDKTKTTLTEQLEKEGVEIHYDENVDIIPTVFKSNTENTLVIYTPAIPKNNKEFIFFQEQGVKLYKRSEVLGLITESYFTIAVAGTHGKTTTSSMVAHVLTVCGVDCIAFLGGISLNFNSNLVLNNKAKIVVVEADEFDRSFLTLSPNIALVTSVDADHLDIYGDHKEMCKTYQAFVNKINEKGILITKPELKKELSFKTTKTYSINQKADYYADSISVDDGKYNVGINNQQKVALGLPGIHNVENAIGAFAVASELGIDHSKIKEALNSYRGVKRRFEYHINEPNLVYIDDYAHHPEELKFAIQSAKELYPTKRITAVFQPHLYTRTRDFIDEFAASLSMLDELILLAIYPARELPIEGINSQLLLDKVTCNKKRLVEKTELIDNLLNSEIEVLLTLGAGDIDVFVSQIKEKLSPSQPSQREGVINTN